MSKAEIVLKSPTVPPIANGKPIDIPFEVKGALPEEIEIRLRSSDGGKVEPTLIKLGGQNKAPDRVQFTPTSAGDIEFRLKLMSGNAEVSLNAPKLVVK